MLIIEDGTGTNPLANSYRSVADLRDYARLRGIDILQKTNAELEVLLIKAMDFLEAQRSKYKGHKLLSTQPLEWPRADVWDVELSGALMPSTEIPRLMEYGQLALAMEEYERQQQTSSGAIGQGVITKEKIGDIEITYSADKPKQNFVAALSPSKALLSPLYRNSGLTLIRS